MRRIRALYEIHQQQELRKSAIHLFQRLKQLSSSVRKETSSSQPNSVAFDGEFPPVEPSPEECCGVSSFSRLICLLFPPRTENKNPINSDVHSTNKSFFPSSLPISQSPNLPPSQKGCVDCVWTIYIERQREYEASQAIARGEAPREDPLAALERRLQEQEEEKTFARQRRQQQGATTQQRDVLNNDDDD